MRPAQLNAVGLIIAFECPYCPRGRGVIAVDGDFALRSLNKYGTSEEAWAHLAADGTDGLLMFDPDFLDGGPCRHLVSYLVDADLAKFEGDEPVERGGSLSGSWDHPWFGVEDRDNALQEYLWTDVNGGNDRGFYPKTAYLIQPFFDERRYPKSAWGLEIHGTVIVARRPTEFFQQLRTGFDAMQAHYKGPRDEQQR